MIDDHKNIDELLVAYLLGELNGTQANEVSEWLAKSEENMRHFEQFVQVWNGSSKEKETSFNADKAWNKIAPKVHKKPFYQSPLFKVAAAVIIILGAANLLFNLSNSRTEAFTNEVLATNEILNDTLQDGSVITLNENTKLSYSNNFNAKTRTVKLEGEAFFDIERDTTKPFIIELDQSSVKILGTSFNIKSDPKDELVSVYVKSGVVLFEYLSDSKDSTYLSVKLLAGDKVVYNKTTQKLEAANDSSTATEIYWMNKELIFDGIRLGQVTNILESVYEVDIVITEETSKNCLLTTNFQNANIDQIMEVIAVTFDLELEKTEQGFTLNGVSCEEI